MTTNLLLAPHTELLTEADTIEAATRRDAGAPAGPSMITVEHAGGTTEVPVDAARIVTLDGYVDLQTLLAFGVDPVLAGVDETLAAGFLAGRLGGLGQVEGRFVENLEVITVARPDLILGAEYDVDRYDELSAIAPTVLIDRYGLSVDEHLRLVGRILGREDRAAEIVAEWAARVAEVAEVVESSPLASRTIAMVGSQGFEGGFSAFGPSSHAGRTMVAVGVGSLIEVGGETNRDDFAFGGRLSFERLEVLAPADLLIVYTTPSRAGGQSVADQPLWPRLPAVEAGAVIEVDSDVWYFDTALSRLARLDDIERIARDL